MSGVAIFGLAALSASLAVNIAIAVAAVILAGVSPASLVFGTRYRPKPMRSHHQYLARK